MGGKEDSRVSSQTNLGIHNTLSKLRRSPHPAPCGSIKLYDNDEVLNIQNTLLTFCTVVHVMLIQPSKRLCSTSFAFHSVYSQTCCGVQVLSACFVGWPPKLLSCHLASLSAYMRLRFEGLWMIISGAWVLLIMSLYMRNDVLKQPLDRACDVFSSWNMTAAFSVLKVLVVLSFCFNKLMTHITGCCSLVWDNAAVLDIHTFMPLHFHLLFYFEWGPWTPVTCSIAKDAGKQCFGPVPSWKHFTAAQITAKKNTKGQEK